MDRLEAMSILLQAVDGGSLSAAGRKLNMPLATVSRKISDLESHLGTRLFIRSSRRLALTESGRSYIHACRTILDQVVEAERAASGEYSTPKGDLVITAPIVFGRLHILPVVADFLRDYPDIHVRLVLSDRLVDFLDDQIDLALRIGPLPDSSLVAAKVGAVRRVVCGRPAYFAKHGLPKAPEDLAAHDCISFAGLTAPDSWTFRVGNADVSVAIRSRLVVNTAEAAIDAALAGVGVTRVLSYQIEAAIRAGTLGVVLNDYEPPPSPVNLVYPGDRLLPLKLRAFVDYAAPRLKARLA